MNRDTPLKREYETAKKEGSLAAYVLLRAAEVEGIALDVEANLAMIRQRGAIYAAIYQDTHVRTEREEA